MTETSSSTNEPPFDRLYDDLYCVEKYLDLTSERSHHLERMEDTANCTAASPSYDSRRIYVVALKLPASEDHPCLGR